jgi:hypothetical protein
MDDYVYTVERELAGAGRAAWRWTVRHRDGAAPLARGTSITSEDDAKSQALAAIRQLTGRTSTEGPEDSTRP